MRCFLKCLPAASLGVHGCPDVPAWPFVCAPAPLTPALLKDKEKRNVLRALTDSGLLTLTQARGLPHNVVTHYQIRMGALALRDRMLLPDSPLEALARGCVNAGTQSTVYEKLLKASEVRRGSDQQIVMEQLGWPRIDGDSR